MTAKKISELPDAATVTGAELIPIVQGGATVKAPASGLPVSTAAQAALDLVGSNADSRVLGDIVYEDDLTPAPQGLRILIDRVTGEFSDMEVMT